MQLDPSIYRYFLDRKGEVSQAAVDGQIKDWHSVAKLEKLIRGLRYVPELGLTDVNLLDGNLDVLNTPSGVLNLVDGSLLPHDSSYLCTRSTRGKWDGEIGDLLLSEDEWREDSLWSRVVLDVMCGDVEMALFMQRLMGYSLLGQNPHEILAFFWGTGANGKSVLTETLAWVLGDYYHSIKAGYLMASYDDSSPSKMSAIAALRGSRLVVSSELTAKQRWDEGLIKSMTSSEPVTAKFMGRDTFDYVPQHLLLVRGNHKPEIGAGDKALWRRFLTVGFEADFDSAEMQRVKDVNLREKLRAADVMNEIFGWLVRGVLEYRRVGLSEPAKVVAFKQEYRAEMNPFGAFLTECCERVDPHPENESFKKHGAMFDDIVSAYRAWIGLNPEIATLDRDPNVVRTSVGTDLRNNTIARGDFWDTGNNRKVRRYALVLKGEWANVGGHPGSGINAGNFGKVIDFQRRT